MFDHEDRERIKEILTIMATLDEGVVAATTALTALTAKVTDLEAQLAAATASPAIPAADQTALEAATAAANAVLNPPAPTPVPEALSVPAQTFSESLGTPTTYQLVAVGGTPPYTFTTSGLPAGLAADGAGVISGTPQASGTSDVSVTVTDSTGATATGTLTVTIN